MQQHQNPHSVPVGSAAGYDQFGFDVVHHSATVSPHGGPGTVPAHSAVGWVDPDAPPAPPTDAEVRAEGEKRVAVLAEAKRRGLVQ